MVEATADKIVGAAVDDDLVEAAAVDQGARMVYEVLAEALLNVPCEQVLSDVRNKIGRASCRERVYGLV